MNVYNMSLWKYHHTHVVDEDHYLQKQCTINVYKYLHPPSNHISQESLVRVGHNTAQALGWFVL